MLNSKTTNEPNDDEISRFLKPGIPESQEQMAPPAGDIPFSDPKDNIPDDIRKWVLGLSDTTPASLSSMMGNVTNKIGMYIAYLIVRRLSKVDSFMNHLEGLETQIFSETRKLTPTSIKDVKVEYTTLTNVLGDFLEFSRKFSMQAKELIRDPERDALVEKIRSLDADSLKALDEAISEIAKSRAVKGTMKKPEAPPPSGDFDFIEPPSL